MKTRNRNILIVAGTLIIGLFFGWLFFGGDSSEEEHEHTEIVGEEIIWTCSMHPQIRAQEEGQCPICGMDLIPLENATGSLNPDAIEMTDYAMKLANIMTQEVGSGGDGRQIRLNGKIGIDERNIYTQSTHIPGRVERLLVNFTGEEVQQGQPLAVLYSPELVTAQEELLQAYKMREQQPELFAAAKAKLGNWRIGENQINRILEGQKASDRFTITADVTGVVTEKLVEPGDYVERGMPLYEIANLSEMWVLFDLYEQALGAVEEGDSIEFTVASLPGETFRGKIEFIDPIVDRQTRVATARVEVDTKDERLKPGMYVSGVVETEVDPEKITDRVVIPESAVLWTGKRSVVYVRIDDGGKPAFVLREVVLGNSLGDSYVIEEGLEPGEEIVVNGAFTVDAAAQLAGKPSMMNPDTGQDEPLIANNQEDIRAYLQEEAYDFRGIAAEEFQQELSKLLTIYLDLKEALVEGNAAEAQALSDDLYEQVAETEPGLLPGEARKFWEEKQRFLMQHAKMNAEAEGLEAMRENFIYISKPLIKAVAAFGANQQLYVDYCPMVEAYWLSEGEPVRNPFMPEMLRCGEVVKVL